MKRSSFILRSRKGRRDLKRSNPLGLAGFLLAIVVSMAGAGGVIYGVSRYADLTRDLPAPETLQVLLDPITGYLLEPTSIYDRQGSVLLWRFTNPSVPDRRYAAITDGEDLFYSDVPEDLILATLASADPDYFLRPESFLAGLLDTKDDPIPEELAADLLLWQEEDHPYREIRVGLLADQITARYGRRKVLEWYLNSTFYGHSIYGAPQAAEFYFEKDLADLDLAECALLAAVGSYPSLNPLDAPRAARENQADVLGLMAAEGFITDSERAAASRQQLIYADPDTEDGRTTPPYVDLILEEASQTIPAERLLRGGFKLVSTVDSQLQGELECTLQHLSLLLLGEEPSLDPDCQAARLLPAYQGPELGENSSLELNLAVLDPVTGELRALAGVNQGEQKLSINDPRLPGSLITPFIYLSAFTQGFEPASLAWDVPLENSSLDLADLHPSCDQDCRYLGPVNIRTALVNDLLSPARQVLDSQPADQLRTTLELFGISPLPGACQDCRIFPESSPLEMVDLLQGFGVFANQGYLIGRPTESDALEIAPAVILRIENRAGVTYPLELSLQENKVISEELAYLVNHALSDQEAWLTPQDREFFRIGSPVGVKLGAVAGSPSGWTIGYSPNHVIGAWAGYSSLEDNQGNPAREISSLLWRATAQYLSRQEESQGWEMPPGILALDVCYPSGNLPTEYCPRIVREVFIEGYQPLVQDTLYQAYQVNRETGRLASVFTPAGQIDDRVYLNVPPLAADWAADSGIETPPDLYDLGDPSPQDSGLKLTTPENLSFVRGRVWITGSIPEENFVSARLQYGPGLNPRSWLQIGEELDSPVLDGFLGTWDTTGLDEGVYALQLVLIKEDQEIEKQSLLLSVDNTAPEIILITDLSGGEVTYQPGKQILLEVQFTNSSEIEQVEIFLDGKQLASRKIGPFVVPWQITPGEHTLLVTAVDQAGNQAELKVTFRAVGEG